MHVLNHKYASLKFTEFTEKLWLKEKLVKVHQNLTKALSSNCKTRTDSYMMSSKSYRGLTIADIVGKIKQLSKKLALDDIGPAF